MKKGLVLLLLWLPAFITKAQVNFNYQKDYELIAARTGDFRDVLYYDKLRDRFTRNDTSLSNFEVLSLLIGFSKQSNFKPKEDYQKEQRIYNLNSEGKYQDAITEAGHFLRTHPVSEAAIIEKSYAFMQLGKKDSADYYLRQFSLIMSAMTYSGSGTSVEDPIFALAPGDAQNYIIKYLVADVGTMTSTTDKAGNYVDVMDVKFADGHVTPYYFITQHAASKVFNGEPKDDGASSKPR